MIHRILTAMLVIYCIYQYAVINNVLADRDDELREKHESMRRVTAKIVMEMIEGK